MTNHPSRRQIASIATNDPDNDPAPRVTLTRTKRDGRYLWLNPEGEMVADGKTAADAENALRYVYSFPAWDLQFGAPTTTTLIHATNASPEITLEWLREMGATADNLRHARDVVADCATQVGRDKCKAAFAELDRLENAFYS